MIPPEIVKEVEALHAEFGEARRVSQRMQRKWPGSDLIRLRLAGEAVAYGEAQKRVSELLKMMKEYEAE